MEDEGVVRRPDGREGRRPGRRPAAATLDPRILDAIVRRIVEIAQPEKIILFGSAARDEMGPATATWICSSSRMARTGWI